MIPNLPKPSRAVFAACSLLMVCLVSFAQFTGLAPPPLRRTPNADFSTQLGEALELTFANTDDLTGSFGSLDLGFGTYVAPRMHPAAHRYRIFFHLEPVDEASGAAPGRRGKSFVTSEPSLLALAAANASLSKSAPRNQFVRAGFGEQSGATIRR